MDFVLFSEIWTALKVLDPRYTGTRIMQRGNKWRARRGRGGLGIHFKDKWK